MAKSKKGLLVLLLSLLVVLTMTILYGCGDNKGGENCTTSGHGSIVTNTDEEGAVSYTAVADKWNVFSGWYDGVDKYSDNKTIIVDSKTPDNLVAKFETSGTLSVDRMLNGSYYRYAEATSSNEKYLNVNYDATLSIQKGLSYSHLKIERGGFISLNGEGFNDYAVVKKGEQTLFTSYYIDDAEDAMLYLDIDGRKVSVEDFTSIGKKLFNLPTLSSEAWNLQNLLDNSMYSMVDNYLGFRNAVGCIESVENAPNQTKITFKVDALLNDLKNKISSVTDPNMQGLKDIIETLTNQYEGIGNLLPKITIEVVADYQTVEGVEKVNSLSINAIFEENYRLELDGNLITIPACKMSCTISKANFALSDSPNRVPAEIISTFPKAVHAINVHADGTLSFLKENVATLELSVIDQYDIDFDTDIDFNAVKDAIEGEGKIDLDEVDWEKLGFISLRVKLIENPDDANQSSRHNGSTEYINLLIDTKKYGAKAFVYIDLYNPQTWSGFATSTYIINASYDIPELIRVMPEIVDNLSSLSEESPEPATTSSEEIASNIISKALLGAINLQFGEMSADQILYELFMSVATKLAPTNSLIQEGMSYSEFGTTLAVEEIKDLIEEEFAEEGATLSNLGLHNNIFGKNTSHIAIKANNVVYGAVTKNANEDYVDDDGKVFADLYNQAHKMLTGVAEGTTIGIEREFTLAGIDDEVKGLVGQEVCIEKAVFSDGSESATFTNCQGNQAQIDMQVYSADYEMIDDKTAEITVYLSFSAGTLQGLMVNTYDIPYGLVAYKFTAELA